MANGTRMAHRVLSMKPYYLRVMRKSIQRNRPKICDRWGIKSATLRSNLPARSGLSGHSVNVLNLTHTEKSNARQIRRRRLTWT